MKQPVIMAISAAIKTAAADKSLITLIAGFFFIEIKSAIFSIAVLKISATHTKPTAKINTITSIRETGKMIDKPITAIVATK